MYLGAITVATLRELEAQHPGVRFETAKVPAGGSSTARCLIMVTPDAERTMNTYLGASSLLASSNWLTTRM